MDKKYEIRVYRDGDEEEIIRLLQQVFGGWPRFDLSCSPLDHWRWKFVDNPMKMNISIICVKDRKIIGCNHAITVRLKVGDKVVLGTALVDLAVHPDFRRLGITNSFRDFLKDLVARRGFKLNYIVTGNPILIKAIPKNSPRFPFTVTNLVRIRDIDLQLRQMPVENGWFMKLAFTTAKVINDVRNVVTGPMRDKADLTISEIRSFDDRIDSFWEEVSGQYDFMVERKRTYLNWRYCDPRGGDFVVKQAEGDGRILGYSVLRINRYLKEYPIGYLVDLVTPPNRLDVADALAVDAVNYFDSNDINIVNYQVVKNNPYERVLGRHGFIDSKIKIYLFYQPRGGEDIMKKIIGSPSRRILVCWGDHDVLPVRMPSYE